MSIRDSALGPDPRKGALGLAVALMVFLVVVAWLGSPSCERFPPGPGPSASPAP
jgi:hypothetical protein